MCLCCTGLYSLVTVVIDDCKLLYMFAAPHTAQLVDNWTPMYFVCECVCGEI